MIDTNEWRVGRRYPIHLYSEPNCPLGTLLDPEISRQIVRDHNALYGPGGLWLNPYPAMAAENGQLRRELEAAYARLAELERCPCCDPESTCE